MGLKAAALELNPDCKSSPHCLLEAVGESLPSGPVPLWPRREQRYVPPAEQRAKDHSRREQRQVKNYLRRAQRARKKELLVERKKRLRAPVAIGEVDRHDDSRSSCATHTSYDTEFGPYPHLERPFLAYEKNHGDAKNNVELVAEKNKPRKAWSLKKIECKLERERREMLRALPSTPRAARSAGRSRES